MLSLSQSFCMTRTTRRWGALTPYAEGTHSQSMRGAWSQSAIGHVARSCRGHAVNATVPGPRAALITPLDHGPGVASNAIGGLHG